MIWGLAFHTWEEIMRGSLLAVGGFGLLAGLATWFVVSLQREEIEASKRNFESYKIEAAKEIESARSDADAKIGVAREEARTAVERAQVDIARAHENTAVLQKEAASARLETERLKETLAWREVTPTQAALLAESLRGQRFDIPLSYTANDPEAVTYADQLADALVAAGVGVETLPTLWAGGPVIGVRVSATNSPQAEALKSALTSAGIPFTLSAPTPELRMSVGGKPRTK